MARTFLTADTHFSHAGVCRFLRADGSKLRPWDDPDDMDEALVENWNRVVGPEDKVYHLGDVAINRRGLNVLPRLNGQKVLIKGNHDIFRLHDYAQHFYDIRGSHVLDRLLLSHIPIHPDSIERYRGNVHGHLHANTIGDPRYLCVSVEHTNFTPIDFEAVREHFANRL